MTGKMILAGDIHMCFAMKQALGINNDRIVFWDVLKRYNKEIPHIQGRDIKKGRFMPDFTSRILWLLCTGRCKTRLSKKSVG